MDWLSQTFSADASEDDIVKARSLNITRITAFVAPVLVGIWTAISEFADKPPFNEVEFQKTLVIVLIGLVAFVTVADILGRSIATGRAAVASAAPFPNALKATKTKKGADVEGKVVAYRATNVTTPKATGEYLFVASDGTATWEPVKAINLK